ncbi:MAG: hypothetical protein WAU00_07570 [Caldilinea sp.]|nr:hypothetical protein [Anaerolineales bacterium]
MKTPDEEVAERIVEQLRTARLLSESGIRKLYPSLVAGNLKAEDWKLLFEISRANSEDADATQNQ